MTAAILLFLAFSGALFVWLLDRLYGDPLDIDCRCIKEPAPTDEEDVDT